MQSGEMIQVTCFVIAGSETRNGLRKFCGLQNSGGLGWAVLQCTICTRHIFRKCLVRRSIILYCNITLL